MSVSVLLHGPGLVLNTDFLQRRKPAAKLTRRAFDVGYSVADNRVLCEIELEKAAGLQRHFRFCVPLG
jgi:hypothetical protein